jgi:[citrate (pro-3S)-lyase] ligase
MYDEALKEESLNMASDSDRKSLQGFLERQGLTLDSDVEYSVVLKDNGRIAASGSFSEKVLKCIAVDDEYKEKGLSARVVTHLVNEQYRRGRTHLFIYTKPQNTQVFSALGFYPLARVPEKVVLMENRRDGIKKYVESIAEESASFAGASDTFASNPSPDISGSIVVNCNPFTLGHKFLIEYAAARCKMLHVFVVWEDRSVFPAETRYQLVREGVAHLNNVTVHKGKDYIISNATFPSYFIKKYEELVETHARLDLEVFAQYIAPALSIKKRFVGKEPYCPVTSVYNKIMKQVLPSHGIEVEEIERITSSGDAISASRVRSLVADKRMNEVRKLVPHTTYEFLVSPEAEGIISKIRECTGKQKL